MSFTRSLIPLSTTLRGRERRVLHGLIVVLAVTSAADVIGSVSGSALRDWAFPLVYLTVVLTLWLRVVCVRELRVAWLLLALGLTSCLAGHILWALSFSHLAAPPVPSPSDALWLALYPCSCVALVLIAREGWQTLPIGVWLEGAIAGLGFAALAAQIVFVHGGIDSAVLTNLAFPIADVVLVGMLLAVLSLRGWRPGRLWTLLGGGCGLLAIADLLLVRDVAHGAIEAGVLEKSLYLCSLLLVALACWQPRAAPAPFPKLSWGALAVPGGFVVVALGTSAYEAFDGGAPLVAILAGATVLLTLVRAALLYRDARAVDGLKDDLLRLVSHEFRTPLTSMHGHLGLLLNGDPLTDAQQRSLAVLERSSRRLQRLVEDLLTVAALDSGAALTDREPLDVNGLAAQCVDAARPTAEMAGLELTLEPARDPVQVTGDAARLGQVVDNLLANAIKFTPSGTIRVSVRRPEQIALIEVADSGIGIAAADQRAVFERFVRSREATERQIPGTGLGLFIARTIVHAHGGTIAIASTEHRGTTVQVRLPALTAAT